MKLARTSLHYSSNVTSPPAFLTTRGIIRNNMKYTIKITKEVPTEEKYPRHVDVYEQSVEVSDSPTMYMTSSTSGGDITPLKVESGASVLVKDVIKAVNQF